MTKKKILSIILAAAIAVGNMTMLSSCSKDTNDKTSEPTSAQTEITSEDETTQTEKTTETVPDTTEKPKYAKDEVKKIIPGKTTLGDLDNQVWFYDRGADDSQGELFYITLLSYATPDSGPPEVHYNAEIKKGKSNKLEDYVIESIEPEGKSFNFGGTEIKYGSTIQDVIDSGLEVDTGFSLNDESDIDGWLSYYIIADGKKYSVFAYVIVMNNKNALLRDAEFDHVEYACYLTE